MRIELFFKTTAQFSSLLDVLKEQNLRDPINYQSFNLPNKVRNENLIPYADKIIKSIPSADVSIHYSLKNNKFKMLSESVNHFKAMLSESEACGVHEVLLVSGSGEKKLINAVTCLQELQRQEYKTNIRLAVAYNPYFFTDEEMIIEQERLRQKLDTGLISTVYFQFGSELALLHKSSDYLVNTIIPQYSHKVNVIGSIFLPSKQLLNRMKFRPWKGNNKLIYHSLLNSPVYNTI